MAKLQFNPNDWISKNESQSDPLPTNPSLQETTKPVNQDSAKQFEDTDKIISLIENAKQDITSDYKDWITIGFALADEFAENGRSLFHRISSFYPKYSLREADKQFDYCLKSNGEGISIKSFFYITKKAGFSINPDPIPQPNSPSASTSQEDDEEFIQLPNFPDSLFSQLPDFLKKSIAKTASKEEKDIILLGSVVCISACIHSVYGIYDGKKVFSNLFLFITAQASAGKGRLVHCRQIVNLIHKELRAEAQQLKKEYEVELSEYNAAKKNKQSIDKPTKPPEKMLFIPANNSSSGAYQLLGESDGRGLIFETEGDTLAQAFKSDHGNYSDGFRKAFHHENISFYRRTDREYIDIEAPCLSTLLSGTPKQVAALIPNAENGLFSRFIFYHMNVRPVWKDVFAIKSDHGLDDYFDALGTEFYSLYSQLKNKKSIQFQLTDSQQEKFNEYFSLIQSKYLVLQGLDYMASIRRLGLIAFRFCMIFTTLRIMETGDYSTPIICEDNDFESVFMMIQVLVQHSAKIHSQLPVEPVATALPNKKEKFLNSLPLEFNRKTYLEKASELNIIDKTAEGYITAFVKAKLIFRDSHDNYKNLQKKNSQET